MISYASVTFLLKPKLGTKLPAATSRDADTPGPPGLKKRGPCVLLPVALRRVNTRVTVPEPDAAVELPGSYASGTWIEPQSTPGGIPDGHSDQVMDGDEAAATAASIQKAVSMAFDIMVGDGDTLKVGGRMLVADKGKY